MNTTLLLAQAQVAAEQSAAAQAAVQPVDQATTATTVAPQSPPPSQHVGQSGGIGTMLFPFLLIFVIFYFVLIRPQRKQQKELRARQNALKAGDKIITAGGIFGIVREVKDTTVRIEVAPNVVIKVARSQVVQTVGKDGSPEGKK